MNFGGFRFAQQPVQQLDWSKLTIKQKLEHVLKRIGSNLVGFHWALFPLFFYIGVNYQPYGHTPISFHTKLYSLLAFLPLPFPLPTINQLEEQFQMQQQQEQSASGAMMGGALSNL